MYLIYYIVWNINLPAEPLDHIHQVIFWWSTDNTNNTLRLDCTRNPEENKEMIQNTHTHTRWGGRPCGTYNLYSLQAFFSPLQATNIQFKSYNNVYMMPINIIKDDYKENPKDYK